MQYGELLKKSFKTVWDHKVIWLFGILLTFFSGSGFNFNTSFPSGPSGPSGLNESSGKEFAQSINQAIHWINTHNLMPFFIAAIVLIVLYIIASFFLMPLFTGSLIGLVKRVAKGEEAGVRDGFSIGARKMFPILGEMLLVGIPTFVAIALLAGIDVLLFILSFSHGSVSNPILLILAIILAFFTFILFIVTIIAVDITNTLAHRFIVIESARVIASIKQAVVTFRKYPGQVLLTGLILVGVGVAAGMAIGVIAIILFIPVFIIGLESIPLAVAVAVLDLIILLVPVGFLKAFESTYWTYAFTALKENDK